MKHQNMTVPASSFQRGEKLRSIIAALACSLLATGNPLPAQEAPIPPLPGDGDIKPRELTPEEIEAQRLAQEARWRKNLERFEPYLIKSYDQLAGEQPVDGPFLSLGDLLWKRFEGGRSVDELKQESDERQEELLRESRDTGIPVYSRTPDGRGTAFEGLDEVGRPMFRVSASLNSAKTIQTEAVWPGGALGLNLSGAGLTVGMWDLEHPYTSHPYFGSGPSARLSIIDWYSSPPYPTTDHATRVAGILGGAQGSGSPGSNAKGMAFGAEIHAYNVVNDFGELAFAYTNYGAIRVTSHNYVKANGWDFMVVSNIASWVWLGDTNVSQNEDAWFGRYHIVSSNIDHVSFKQPFQLQVWSAGNEGTNGQGMAPPSQPTNHYVWPGGFLQGIPQLVNGSTRAVDGDAGGFDSLPPEATAKNSIAVGSVTNLPTGYQGTNSVLLSNFSSYGPSDSGLIKPDVVAAGENVWAPIYPDTVNSKSGTSFAAPSVAGSVLLLRQHYLQTHGTTNELLASTLKALVIHTADEVGAPGPDFKHGWGLKNTAKSAQLITANTLGGQHLKELVLQAGGKIRIPLWVISTNERVKATIVWTDPASTPPALILDPTNSVLVNDLDLRVISPSGVTNLPWVLNPDLAGKSAAARSAPATKGDDNRNPVEQVEFWPVETGAYWAEITHKGTVLYGAGGTNLGYQMVSAIATGNVSEPQSEPLQILDFAPVSSTHVAFLFNSEPGEDYRVRYKNNLSMTNWLYGPDFPAMTELTAISLPVYSTSTNRFYRLDRLP